MTTAPLPLHSRIREDVRGKIHNGVYPAHSKIPSEKDFMDDFGVSRITVRQAMGDLEKEGLIFKIPGKGSYVTPPKARPVQDLTRLQGFGEAMARLGFETRNEVLSIRTVAAPAKVALQLKCPVATPVTEIRRVRSLDGSPISLDVTYVPEWIGERLAQEDLVTRDIFLILENDYGIALGHADLSIDAITAQGELADHLDIQAGAPMLHIERIACSQSGEPIEYDEVYYRGDAFRYQLRLDRRG